MLPELPEKKEFGVNLKISKFKKLLFYTKYIFPLAVLRVNKEIVTVLSTLDILLLSNYMYS